MTIWVGSTSLRWRAELRFFEQRAGLLRHFDDQNILQAFLWNEQSVELRVGDFTTIVIEPTGMSITVGTPKKPSSECDIVLNSTMEYLKPKDVAMGPTQYKVLVEIDDESVVAQRRSAELLPGSKVSESSYLDWALLVDGQSSSIEKSYQVEFGVLSPGEAEGRLSGTRQSLRMTHSDGMKPVDVGNLPENSLYLNWWWQSLERLPDEGVLTRAHEHWKGMEVETMRVSASICDQLGLHARINSPMEEGK